MTTYGYTVYSCPRCGSNMDWTKFYLENGSQVGRCNKCELVSTVHADLKCPICSKTATHQKLWRYGGRYTFHCYEHFLENMIRTLFRPLIVLCVVALAIFIFLGVYAAINMPYEFFKKGGIYVFVIPFLGFLFWGIYCITKIKKYKKLLEELKVTYKIRKDSSVNRGSVIETDVIEMIKRRDISGLLRSFNFSKDWKGRELVVVALGNICKELRQDSGNDSSEMISALNHIIMLSKTETTGGTYRQNCIDHAQMLLNLFQK